MKLAHLFARLKESRTSRGASSGKRWIAYLAAISSLLWGLDSSAAPKTVCFGDSVTQGSGIEDPADTWCAKLGGINAGIGGNDTRQALARFVTDVLRHKPKRVIMMFGLGDSYTFDRGNGGQVRIELEEYKANYRKMIRALKRRNIEVILMTSNPTLYFPANLIMRPYIDHVRWLAKHYDLKLVDLYSAFAQQVIQTGDWAEMLQDGIHPTVYGNEFIYAEIVRVLQ